MPDDTGRVEVEWWDNLARIAVVTSSDEKERSLIDGPSFSALTDELNILRETVDHAPHLVWIQDRDRTVTWANKAYTDLAIHHSDIESEKTWPLKALFETLPSLLEEDARRVWRACLKPGEDAAPNWYEISSIQQGDHTLFFATDINTTIKAEEALRDFVQTLSKTFAQLPTGLAIFDKKRQLVLFNPALLNMVGLSPEFLSIRPTLFAFLDKLRERQMVPEPKDYRSWQQQMSDLEAAAVDGTYSEVWNLPSGLTYRVTGRPHPGGGVAFLFDDISAEISLTRRFRSQLEQGQAVIDNLDEAIIVFASNGSVTLSNNKYKTLWAEDIVQEVVETNINDALTRWQLLSDHSDIWEQLRLFSTSTNERSSWSGNVTLQNGQVLQCRAEALPRGATLIAFKKLVSEPPQLEIAVS
nr:PAS-domain containing protein [Pseudaestuariivita rosea]